MVEQRPLLTVGADAGTATAPKIRVEGLSYWYGTRQSLNGITLDIRDRAVTVIFGPAGGGKTTLA